MSSASEPEERDGGVPLEVMSRGGVKPQAVYFVMPTKQDALNSAPKSYYLV